MMMVDDVVTSIEKQLGIINDGEISAGINEPDEVLPFTELEIDSVETFIEDGFLSRDDVKDYITSRNNLYTLIKMSGKALSRQFKLCEVTEAPRMMSILGDMIATHRNLTKDLNDLQTQFQRLMKNLEIETNDPNEDIKSTTASLLTMLEESEKE